MIQAIGFILMVIVSYAITILIVLTRRSDIIRIFKWVTEPNVVNVHNIYNICTCFFFPLYLLFTVC